MPDKKLITDIFDTLFVMGAGIGAAVFFNNPWAGLLVGCVVTVYLRKK